MEKMAKGKVLFNLDKIKGLKAKHYRRGTKCMLCSKRKKALLPIQCDVHVATMSQETLRAKRGLLLCAGCAHKLQMGGYRSGKR